LRGDVLVYVAQGNPLIDAKIAEKRRFQTGTSLFPSESGQRGAFSKDRGLSDLKVLPYLDIGKLSAYT